MHERFLFLVDSVLQEMNILKSEVGKSLDNSNPKLAWHNFGNFGQVYNYLNNYLPLSTQCG